MRRSLPFYLLLGCTALAGLPQQSVNAGGRIQKDFEKRVDEYLKLRKTVREGLPKLKPTGSAGTIESHESGLALRIREARRGARRGDIFTTDISAAFRKLMASAMQGEDAVHIRESLRRAEPVRLETLHVDGSYPEGVPLQSTPPTLLLSLPKLPQELEYRLVGHALVLLDVEANLIVDFIPDALPARTNVP